MSRRYATGRLEWLGSRYHYSSIENPSWCEWEFFARLFDR